jgi:hypothetical protein
MPSHQTWPQRQARDEEWRKLEAASNSMEGREAFEHICPGTPNGAHVVAIGRAWTWRGDDYEYLGVNVACSYCQATVFLHPERAARALLRSAEAEGLIRHLPLLAVDIDETDEASTAPAGAAKAKE